MDRVDYQSLVIQDLLNLKRKDELNLNPWYQRRSVWQDSQKSYLINTILEHKPIPAIYIRHTIDIEQEKSLKEVVDGQQRIRAILDFCNNEISTTLPGSYKRVRYKDFSPEQKQSFLMTPLSIGYLQGASDQDVIDIFARINSVSKSLNSQEKRNSLYSGCFKQFCVNESSKRLPFFRAYGIFSANDISRMNEVQFMSDLVVNMIDGLSSYSSGKLDKYYKQYDQEFEQAEFLSLRLDKLFSLLLSIEPSAIQNTIFSRQPLLFSLIIALNSQEDLKIDPKRIANALLHIDEIYNSDLPIEGEHMKDLEFKAATQSTTQGQSQREIRDKYIKSFILQ